MPTAEARVATERPSRYLVQLCRHADHMGGRLNHGTRTRSGGDAPPAARHVEWSDTDGIIDVGWGRCTLLATPDTLTLRVEAADEESLRRIEDLIAQRLGQIGRRDGLEVTWQRPEAFTGEPAESTPTARRPAGGGVARRVRTTGLLIGGTLVVAAHLGLGGSMLVDSPWTAWATDIVLALVLLKISVLAGVAIHRSRASKGR